MNRFLELITNPTTGRLSTSDFTLLAAFLVSAVIVLFHTFTDQLNEWEFGLFLGVWAAQRGAAKLTAMRYTPERKTDDPA